MKLRTVSLVQIDHVRARAHPIVPQTLMQTLQRLLVQAPLTRPFRRIANSFSSRDKPIRHIPLPRLVTEQLGHKRRISGRIMAVALWALEKGSAQSRRTPNRGDFPSGKKRLIDRAWYAATRVVVGRSDSGHSTFNSADFLGALLASSLQNAYYPRHDRTFGDTMNRFEGALGSDATSFLLREFTPDIKRFFKKHAPERVKRIERKLPIPAEDKL